MNQDFIKLVNDEYGKLKSGERNCFYIGEGNPDAEILIIGNECARVDNEEDVAADNIERWERLLDRGYNAEDIRRELSGYKGMPDNRYHPLFPWFGQKCIVRSQNGQQGEEGTARTWVQYQKLTDGIYGREFDRNNLIDFHLHAFHTELSQIPRMQSGAKNKYTEDSINDRLNDLFKRQPFFKKFPVVIIAAGHYVKKYNINIVDNFNVEYKGDCGDESGWINLHHGKDDNMPRLLIHTRHFAGSISDNYIKSIAGLVKQYIER